VLIMSDEEQNENAVAIGKYRMGKPNGAVKI
jgi:hypothetical protein